MEISKLKSELRCDEPKPVKRPFDVAFLMLPDEKLKQKQKSEVYDNSYNSTEEDEEIDIVDSPREYKKSNLLKPKNLDDLRAKGEQKSAFTKVNMKESRLSPTLSTSPDLNYQSSLSPSPPIINKNYQNFPTMVTPNRLFKTQQLTYQNQNPNQFLHDTAASNLEAHFFKSQPELIQPNFSKLRPIYRPDLAFGYQQSTSNLPAIYQPELRGPAAAILTSLLPPSLAALSLPAQNICAKCNISFRMTSDLVYHMRSHHKNDAPDAGRKKREDKLKCPVCAEELQVCLGLADEIGNYNGQRAGPIRAA
ncbi:unnamed protein product [Phyllotreta striolata]|uniref:C2H2-type domain-containing protein n=1 Tax=Phyllotreta striolata TaxID=444603 RepID=A0A9N9TYE8_PHYSR|nr:unnamed protein product [Phyllotreta striolata]